MSDKKQVMKRVIRGQQEIHHDLFKLKSAKMIKNVGIGDDEQHRRLVQLEHCHVFHTYDSNGKRLNKCNSVGGHYHDVLVIEKDGKFEVECSTAKTDKLNGGPKMFDDHKHDLEYLGSDLIKSRQVSKEAQEFIAKQG